MSTHRLTYPDGGYEVFCTCGWRYSTTLFWRPRLLARLGNEHLRAVR